MFCGRPLPPRKKRWCGVCAEDYLRARGFTYRQDCIDRVMKQYGRIRCEMCGIEPEDALAGNIPDWQADHKVPLALGGSHDPSNVWLLCPKCTAVKNASDLRAIYLHQNPSIAKKIEEEERRAKDRRLDDYNG